MYKQTDAIAISQYLLDQTIEGPRIMEFGLGNSCKCYVMPRDTISEMVSEYEELRRYCIYILLGEDDEGTPIAYIGESKDFSDREKTHNLTKKFWNKALVFISTANDIYQSEIDYLEHLAQKTAKEAGFMKLDNKRIEPEPDINPVVKGHLNKFFKNIMLLTRMYGCLLFEKPGEPKQDKKNLIFCTLARNSSANGLLDPDTGAVIVLKGSNINPKNLPNLKGSALEKRLEMIKKYAKKDGETLVLKQDVTFESPSGAAKFCIGGAADGWISWIDNEGRPINVYRKK